MTEHVGKGSIVAADGKVHCYAWVTLSDGVDYDDEIHLGIEQPGVADEVNVFLTDAQARELRRLIDTALANRAEVRAA